MQILHLLVAAFTSCKFRGKFVFVHHLPHSYSSFQIAHSLEHEGLVWKVVGSIPGEVIVFSSSRLQLIGTNIAVNSCLINNCIHSCSICSLKMQICQPKVTSVDSCKYCNKSATVHVTQLIAAIFATQIFAVY